MPDFVKQPRQVSLFSYRIQQGEGPLVRSIDRLEFKCLRNLPCGNLDTQGIQVPFRADWQLSRAFRN